MRPGTISESVWQALGWAMLHFLWVGAVIGVFFWAIERLLLRRATPGARYSHGLVCLLALVLAAGFCVWQEWPPAPSVEVIPLAARDAELSLPPLSVVPTVAPRYPEAAVPEILETISPTPESFRWIEILPWVWFGGSAAFTIFLAIGLAGTWRLRHGADRQKATKFQRRCDALRAGLGISRGVAVAVSQRIQAPLMVGVFRPLIILPASALSGMSPAMVEWILLHELAHVRRWDNAVILFQRMAECVLFFHPCIWLASRWVDHEREYCCDRFILSKNQDRDPVDYARTLAALAGVPGVALCSTMANHAVVQRIRRIVHEKESSCRGGGVVVGVMLVSLLAIALCFGPAPANAEAQELAVVENSSTKDEGEEPALPEEGTQQPSLSDLPPVAEEKPVADPPVAEPPVPVKPAPVSKPDGNGFVATVYRVPPNLMSQFPGIGSLQSRLEKKGFQFPPGSVAIFEPRKALVALNHRPETIGRLAKLIEAYCVPAKPQVLLTSILELKRGEEIVKMTAPSVVTLSHQRAKIEVIRELIYPTNAKNEKPAYDMTPIGLEIEIEPIASRNSLDVEISGYVQIRLVKGTDIDQYFANPESLSTATIDHVPEFDVYRKPFKQKVKSGESVEIELGKVPGRGALLKRKRLKEGKITARLSVQLINPSGRTMDTVEKLRATFPKFKLSGVALQPNELAAAERRFSVALAAYDLGNFVLAEAGARSALAHLPGDVERLAFWNLASRALSEKKRHPRGKPDDWIDRSYRLRAPLMPSDCATDPEAIATFMKRCGMGLPAGATVKVGDDGMTLIVHNLGRELEKLETALGERVSLHSGNSIWIDVEVAKNVGEIAGLLGKDPVGKFGVAGVFTDPQYQVFRRVIERASTVKTMPRQIVASGGTVNALKGSPLKNGLIDWACGLQPSLGLDGQTIEVTMRPTSYEADEKGKKVFTSSTSTNSVTIWVGQWIALGRSNDNGNGDLVFIRVRKAKL